MPCTFPESGDPRVCDVCGRVVTGVPSGRITALCRGEKGASAARSRRSGPGAELARLIERIKLPIGCGACRFRAAEMDRWGGTECRQRLPEIAGWLRESWKELAWTAKLKAARALRSTVEWTRPFESLVELAIALSESSFPQNEVLPIELTGKADASEEEVLAAMCPSVSPSLPPSVSLSLCPPGGCLAWTEDRPICDLPIEPSSVTGMRIKFAYPGGGYFPRPPRPLPKPGKLIRIDQQAGFGDAIELTCVLRHLRHYYPRARMEVVTEPDRMALYSTEIPDPTIGCPLVDRILDRSQADYCTHPLTPWPGHSRSFRGCPSSPAEHCLVDRLGLEPIAELCHYWVPGVQSSGADRAGLPTIPVALCHFAGDHRMPQKNLTLEQRSEVVCQIRCAGYSVTVLGEDATAGNAAELIGLIESCDLFIGVDSGPLHLASALGKRAIGLWTYLSPLHCFCPDATTTHLLWRGPAKDYERWRICRPVDDGLDFFRANYRYQWCDNFGAAIAEQL